MVTTRLDSLLHVYIMGRRLLDQSFSSTTTTYFHLTAPAAVAELGQGLQPGGRTGTAEDANFLCSALLTGNVHVRMTCLFSAEFARLCFGYSYSP